MATLPSTHRVVAPAKSADAQDVWVEYDKTTNKVTVTPQKISKGATVRFKDPKGGKLRIVFLSPGGKETDSVSDSQSYTLVIGGTYHFKCYFTPPGAKRAINPDSGGILDVVPQRP